MDQTIRLGLGVPFRRTPSGSLDRLFGIHCAWLRPRCWPACPSIFWPQMEEDAVPDEVRPHSEEELVWLRQAEEHILQLLREHYGTAKLDRSFKDLELAQRLVDDAVVGENDELELQCLGVVLGNVFAATTSMQWAVVSNEWGTMLALHSSAISFTLYPLTMISKRIRDNRDVDIPALYRSLANDLGLLPPPGNMTTEPHSSRPD